MKQKTIVRSLEDADPNYAVAKELLRKLKAAMSKIDAEESDLLFRNHNRPPGAERTARVAALLGEADPETASAPDGVSARLKAIAGERVDLRTAVDIAQQRLATARHGASTIICAEVKSSYSDRVKAVASTLIAAYQAHGELLSLIDDLTQAEVAWTGALPPMQATAIFSHDGDRLTTWLHDAATAGFIAKTEIPKELAR